MSSLPALGFALLLAQDPAHWSHWRGPTADGVARTAVPTRWSDAESVRWRVELPGRGVSTPVVYGESLFFTTAVPLEEDEPSAGDTEKSNPIPPHSFRLFCLDRRDGSVRWQVEARVATPHEGHHKTYGSFASASPVTDGETVFASFGSQGLYAYDLAGKQRWSFDPGVRLSMRNAFGEGLAPVLAGGAVVQVADQEQGSFVFAVDRATGKELWRASRDEPSTWATPLVTEVGGVLQVITAGTHAVRAYEPASGKLLWQAGGVGLNAIPNVVRAGDLALVMSGYREARLIALDLASEGHAEKWRSTQGCAYTASPVLAHGLFYTVTDRGQLSCFDAQSGRPHYLEERLPRGSTLKSSPIAAGEFLYLPTEAGDVHVVRLGPKYEVVATNNLSEQVFLASPAAAEGALYLRSLTTLFCIESGG